MKYLFLILLSLSVHSSAIASTPINYWCDAGDYNMSITINNEAVTVWTGNSDWSYCDERTYEGSTVSVQNGMAHLILDIKIQNADFPGPKQAELVIPAAMLSAKTSADVTFNTVPYGCW